MEAKLAEQPMTMCTSIPLSENEFNKCSVANCLRLFVASDKLQDHSSQRKAMPTHHPFHPFIFCDDRHFTIWLFMEKIEGALHGE
jgi:hypothetical protein